VKLFSGNTQVGSTVVDSTGLWSITTTAFKDGLNYTLYGTATDAAGNVSTQSKLITFNIDAHAPLIPTGTITLAAGANNPAFSGGGEVGTAIDLVNVNNGTIIGHTTVGSDGTWRIPSVVVPNGSYSVSVVSSDAAENATTSSSRIDFNIASTANITGDKNNNVIIANSSNNGIDGGAGFDTVVYGTARANYTVQKAAWGYSVVDKTGAQGTDTLVNVERIHFSDDNWVALDLDGNAGQVYRMYQAALDRTPDPRGYAFWLDQMDQGVSLDKVAELVLANKEATDIYLSNPTDSYFITQLYHHVLHREPDAAGLAWWLQNVQYSSRAHVLALFTESPENQAQVIGTIQNGIEYSPWHGA
jgi:hypothetical protein